MHLLSRGKLAPDPNLEALDLYLGEQLFHCLLILKLKHESRLEVMLTNGTKSPIPPYLNTRAEKDRLSN